MSGFSTARAIQQTRNLHNSDALETAQHQQELAARPFRKSAAGARLRREIARDSLSPVPDSEPDREMELEELRRKRREKKLADDKGAMEQERIIDMQEPIDELSTSDGEDQQQENDETANDKGSRFEKFRYNALAGGSASEAAPPIKRSSIIIIKRSKKEEPKKALTKDELMAMIPVNEKLWAHLQGCVVCLTKWDTKRQQMKTKAVSGDTFIATKSPP